MLLIDADPAWTLTGEHLGFDPDGYGNLSQLVDPGVADGAAADVILEAPGEWSLHHDQPWAHGGTLTDTGALAFIPGDPALGNIVAQHAAKPRAARYLARALRGVARHFDLVLIDSGSTTSSESWLCLEAAGGVVLVSPPEDGGVKGTLERIEFIDFYADQAEIDIDIAGVICARYNVMTPGVHSRGLARLREAMSTIDTDGQHTRLIDVPAYFGQNDQWQAGPLVWPSLQPQSSALLAANEERRPLATTLLPGRKRSGTREEFLRREVLPYTRNALRMLQVTGAPVLDTIREPLLELGLSELWQSATLRGDDE